MEIVQIMNAHKLELLDQLETLLIRRTQLIIDTVEVRACVCARACRYGVVCSCVCVQQANSARPVLQGNGRR